MASTWVWAFTLYFTVIGFGPGLIDKNNSNFVKLETLIYTLKSYFLPLQSRAWSWLSLEIGLGLSSGNGYAFWTDLFWSYK